MLEIFFKLFLTFTAILLPAVIHSDSISEEKVPEWVAKFLGVCVVGWVVSVFGMIWSA